MANSTIILTDSVRLWIADLDAGNDKLLMRRAYIDLCGGDHVMACIFSQLMYYSHPDSTGKPSRMRVKRDGHYWLAKQHSDWSEECRVPTDMARRKIDHMRILGLVIAKNYRFDGKKTQHLRINCAGVEQRIKALADGENLKPVCSPRINRKKSNRFDAGVQTGLSPGVKPLTETTNKDYEQRNEIPKSLSQERDFSDSSSSPNTEFEPSAVTVPLEDQVPGVAYKTKSGATLTRTTSTPGVAPNPIYDPVPGVAYKASNRVTVVQTIPKSGPVISPSQDDCPGVACKGESGVTTTTTVPAKTESGVPQLPATHDPAFPKTASGHPDWRAGVARFDAELARAFDSIFPNQPGTLQSDGSARSYYKKRHGGSLRPKDIRLLEIMYRKAHSDDIPAKEWRKSSPSELLNGKHLTRALEICRSSVREQMSELADQMELITDEGIVKQQIHWAAKLMVEAEVRSPEALQVYLRPRSQAADVCASLLVARHFLNIYTVDAAIEHESDVVSELTQNHGLRQYYKQHGLEPMMVFAKTDEEITALQNAGMQELLDEMEAYRALL